MSSTGVILDESDCQALRQSRFDLWPITISALTYWQKATLLDEKELRALLKDILYSNFTLEKRATFWVSGKDLLIGLDYDRCEITRLRLKVPALAAQNLAVAADALSVYRSVKRLNESEAKATLLLELSERDGTISSPKEADGRLVRYYKVGPFSYAVDLFHSIVLSCSVNEQTALLEGASNKIHARSTWVPPRVVKHVSKSSNKSYRDTRKLIHDLLIKAGKGEMAPETGSKNQRGYVIAGWFVVLSKMQHSVLYMGRVSDKSTEEFAAKMPTIVGEGPLWFAPNILKEAKATFDDVREDLSTEPALLSEFVYQGETFQAEIHLGGRYVTALSRKDVDLKDLAIKI